MKLISVHLQNFRQHADSSIHFPPAGVVGLLGANESGKSTILEAASWALFGADAIRDKMSTVRWKRAPGKRQAEATLEFEVAGVRYRVERTEREAKLIAADTGIPLAAGTAAVNGAVPGLLGMAWPEFRASYLTAQKDLSRISAMKPTERQGFVREVLGIGRIDAALERCRSRKNELSREVAGAQAGLGERTPLAAEAEAAEQFVTATEDALDAAGDSVTAAESAAQEAAATLSVSELHRRRYEDLTRRRDDAGRDRDQAAAEISKLGADIDAARAAQAQLREQEPALGELPALRAERENLRVAEARSGERRALLGRLEGATREVAEADQRIAEAAATIAAHDEPALRELADRFTAAEDWLRRLREGRQARIGAARTSAGAAADRAQQLRQQVDALRDAGPNDPCPMCTRPLGDHFDEVVGQLELDASELDVQRGGWEDQARELADPDDDEMQLEASVAAMRAEGERRRTVRDAAARASQDHEASAAYKERAERDIYWIEGQLALLPGVPFDAERFARCVARIRELEQLDESLRPLREATSRLQVLYNQDEQWRARRVTAVDRCEAACTQLEMLHFDAGHHAELQDAAAAASRAHTDAEKAQARAAAEWDGAVERLRRAELVLQDYDARAARVRSTAEQLRVHERAAQALNRFRIAAASTIRPELEELTSGFVALLTDGRHECVTLGEDFAVTLHEGGVPVEVVSGGTEDIAALALRLAVSQMIAERAGHPLSLLILDEPFGSLDETRRGNVLTLIRLLGSVFEQVLLISHVEETRTAVDHAISVEYLEAEGRSVVRQASVAVPALEHVAAA